MTTCSLRPCLLRPCLLRPAAVAHVHGGLQRGECAGSRESQLLKDGPGLQQREGGGGLFHTNTWSEPGGPNTESSTECMCVDRGGPKLVSCPPPPEADGGGASVRVSISPSRVAVSDDDERRL